MKNMADLYYSEFINEKFYSKITTIRDAKGLKDDLLCKVDNFVFIFVDKENNTCKNVKENELETTIVENDKFTNIVVFCDYCTRRGEYLNSHFLFIGIFDKKGNESTIELDSIVLNSVTIGCIGYGYDYQEITSCNITLLDNPFRNYLRKTIRPVKKAINSFLNNEWKCDSFEFEEEEFTIDVYIKKSYRIPHCFEDFLSLIQKNTNKISILTPVFDTSSLFKEQNIELKY